jgi:PleD family two-component response regulator
MIDIDYFKNVNDTLGHLTGDKILHSLVDLLNNETNIKYICRYGGDEFIIIHEKPIDFIVHNELFLDLCEVSFSFGTVYKEKYDKMSEVLAEVDKLLYKQKRAR